MLLQPECYRNKLRFKKVTHLNFFGAKFPGPNITYPLEFTWITAKISNKWLVRKSLGPTEKLWVELIIFFQADRNVKQSKKRKGQIRNISRAELPRPIIAYLLETSCIAIEVSWKHFLLQKFARSEYA